MLDPNAHLGEFHRFDKFPYAGTGLAQKKTVYTIFSQVNCMTPQKVL
jgi:hypothetical protein